MEDQMLLENLDEKFEDETPVVTAKWLSTEFNQPIYESEKLLSNYFLKRQHLWAVDLLCGLDSNNQVVVKLAPHDKLEKAKNEFSQPPTTILHSLHRNACKNSSSLASMDLLSDVTQEGLQRLCTIPWDPLAAPKIPLNIVGNDRMPSAQVSQANEHSATLPKLAVSGKDSHVKTNDVKNFFASVSKPKTKTAATTLSKPVHKRPSNNPQFQKENKAVPSTAAVITSEDEEEFLTSSVSSAKRKRIIVESDEELDLPPVVTSTVKVQETSNESNSTLGNSQTRTERKKSANKQILVEDSETDSPARRPSRGRKSQGNHETTECVVKKNEKPKKSITPSVSQPSPKKTNGSSKVCENLQPGKPNRVRHQVLKTFQDEDGFMVTEKAWESASEEDEQPGDSGESARKAEKVPEKRTILETSGSTQSTAASNLETSKSSEARGKTSKNKNIKPAQKQASLSSFFKRT